MSNSTLPKAVTDYFSSLGKRGGATKTRKGFAVGGDPREAQAKSVEARKRNSEARKRNSEARKAAEAANGANGAKVQSPAESNQ